VPRTEWGADWVSVPNKISLFRLPLEEDYPDPDDLADEVRITVIHELAHHLGIDDSRLHDLGID
jgi:predicted Zn-dependent protease with MMP-like domain